MGCSSKLAVLLLRFTAAVLNSDEIIEVLWGGRGWVDFFEV